MPSPTNAPAPSPALVASAEGEPVTDLDHARYDRDGWMESALRAQGYVGELQGRLAAALARAERAETSRDAEATKLADELEGWFRRGCYRPGDHLPSAWQHDLGGRIARDMRLVLRALRSCPAAALAHPAPAEEE